MGIFYSPAGNAEVWASRPAGYLSEAEWLAGNPPVPEPETQKTVEEIIAEYDALVERRLSAWAKLHGYMSADRLLSYQNSTIPRWKFEADNFRALCWDPTWAWAQSYLNAGLAQGNPAVPAWETLEALLDEHVPLSWPEYTETEQTGA